MDIVGICAQVVLSLVDVFRASGQEVDINELLKRIQSDLTTRDAQIAADKAKEKAVFEG